MRQYAVRYVVFWLPALLVSYFFSNQSMTSQVLQWFFAFFLLLGWSVNTGMAAYNFPRATLSLWLAYTGLHILAITSLYAAPYGSGRYTVLKAVSGFLSYRPLRIFTRVLEGLVPQFPPELCILGGLSACCLIGYLIGLVQRRVNPNPYRPRILR